MAVHSASLCLLTEPSYLRELIKLPNEIVTQYPVLPGAAKQLCATARCYAEKLTATVYNALTKEVIQLALSQATCFATFVGSVYLFARVYDLMIQLDSYLCNTERYQRELQRLYEREIKRTLEYATIVLDQSNCQPIAPEAIKQLTEKLQKFNDKLKDMLEKIEYEEGKVKESKTESKVVGVGSVCAGAVTATAAFLFPPTGAVLAGGYLATGLLSIATAVVSYRSNGELNMRATELNEMILKIDQYKDEISEVNTKLGNVLIEFTRLYEIAYSRHHSPIQASLLPQLK